jgi:DNA repair ATPase RecN
MSFEDFYKKPKKELGRDMSVEQEHELQEITRKLEDGPRSPFDPDLRWKMLEQDIDDHHTILVETQKNITELCERLNLENTLQETSSELGVIMGNAHELTQQIRHLQPYLVELNQHIKKLKAEQMRIENLIPDNPKDN